MSILVESTSTSLEADKARTASAQKTEVDDTESASSESEDSELQDENSEASDTSEKSDEDEADSTDSDNEEGLKDESKEDKPKKESKLAKRLKKLSSERTQARLDADQARREAEFLRSELQRAKSTYKADDSKVQEQSQKTEGEPNPEEFDTNAAYIKAFTKWEIAQEKAALAKESQQAQLKTEYQKQFEKHNERVNQFKAKQSDYEQVVEDFMDERGDVRFSAALEECVLSSDYGPAVIFELMKDPAKFDRMNSLSGNEAMREFGKIEARLESSSEKNKEIKTTKAPAPISPIGNGSATFTKSLNDPNISFAEYEKIRMKQLKKQ